MVAFLQMLHIIYSSYKISKIVTYNINFLMKKYLDSKFSLSFFTGQMLMKWLISSLQQSGNNLSEQDLNNLTIQYCNNLINVGVLKQISEETDIKNFSVSNIHTYVYLYIEVTDKCMASDRRSKLHW